MTFPIEFLIALIALYVAHKSTNFGVFYFKLIVVHWRLDNTVVDSFTTIWDHKMS